MVHFSVAREKKYDWAKFTTGNAQIGLADVTGRYACTIGFFYPCLHNRSLLAGVILIPKTAVCHAGVSLYDGPHSVLNVRFFRAQVL